MRKKCTGTSCLIYKSLETMKCNKSGTKFHASIDILAIQFKYTLKQSRQHQLTVEVFQNVTADLGSKRSSRWFGFTARSSCLRFGETCCFLHQFVHSLYIPRMVAEGPFDSLAIWCRNLEHGAVIAGSYGGTR